MTASMAGAAAFIVLTASMSAAQQARRPDATLLHGAAFKAQTLFDGAASDLQKIGRDIADNDLMIKKAEDLVARAGQTGNARAESVARDALANARAAKRKNEDTRARLEMLQTRASAAIAAIRNKLAADPGTNPPIQGMVGQYSGRADILKRSGETAPLDTSNPGFLESGDELITYAGSSAEIQTLDGRGTVRLGEASAIRVEEKTPEAEALRVLRGRIYSAVESMDEVAARLQEQAAQSGRDVSAAADAAMREYAAILARTRARFEVRTPTGVIAVRGTRFSVEIKDDGATELTCIEGSVEVGDIKGGRRIVVAQGFKAIATRDAISAPQRIGDVERWWEK